MWRMRDILFVFLDLAALAHGREIVADDIVTAQDKLLDNLVDGLFNQAFQSMPFYYSEMANTTYGKLANFPRSSNLQISRIPTRSSVGFPASRSLALKEASLLSRMRGATRAVVGSRKERNLVVSRAEAAALDDDTGFDLSKISFGTIVLSTGTVLLLYGFTAYFLPGAPLADLSPVMLIYGLPASVLGAALKYAELAPVPCKSTQEALELRPKQMTDIQKQVREDVTRYRYGDEAHLELALEKIFLVGRPGGLRRSVCPTLVGVKEKTIDGAYTLVLEFEDNPEAPKDAWDGKAEKFTTFFGPGLQNSTMEKTKMGMEVSLISDGSGTGMNTGKADEEILPPLVVGLPSRKR